jgi:16S rRNA (guanine527-N7)-methyltransferase
MDIAKIAELLTPFLAPNPIASAQGPGSAATSSSVQKSAGISKSQLEYISIYIDLLLRWNLRVNLTSIRQPEEVVTRHFGESLFVAWHLFPTPIQDRSYDSAGSTSNPVVIDVGSGAGFPGLPIKLWAPPIHLTLIEANQKKATFLREVVRALSLSEVTIFAGRSGDFPKNGAGADVVTLRAVEQLNSTLPAVADLVAPGGRLAILVGESQVPSVERLLRGFDWDGPSRLPLSSRRTLIIGRKESISTTE